MFDNVNWGIVIGLGGILISILGIIIGLVFTGKKNVQNIKPRSKNGNIDMSQGEFTVDKHIHYNDKEIDDKKYNKK